MDSTHVIVGASLAGATAAIALREQGARGRVLMIGAETDLPYERPPLSKAYLRGETPSEHAPLRPAAFFADQRIEIMLGTRVTNVDAEGKALEIGDGTRIPFDTLRIIITLYSIGESEWSIGTTPSDKAQSPRATCSANEFHTTTSTGSGRINTT
jgi:NAD(P)H-nitrite reductase large subunit